MQNTLIIIHVVISVILILVVLMQQAKQQGLSGAIGGGAETFYGKNKGRTLDALLNKITTVVAILFVISAIALTIVSVNESKAEEAAATDAVEVDPSAVQAEPAEVEIDPAALEGATEVTDADVTAEGDAEADANAESEVDTEAAANTETETETEAEAETEEFAE